MKKNKYKVTRKDIENSSINYSFTEVAIKNMANRKSAYNINKLQQENKQLEEQHKLFTDYLDRLGFNNFNDFEEWMGTFLLTPHEEQTLIKELKEQLAEKGKEIEYWQQQATNTTNALTNDGYVMIMKTIRKQVCDNIRDFIQKNESPSFSQSLCGYWFISAKKLFEYLDQIEQKENLN